MNKFLKVLLSLALVLILSVPGLARDWYVNNASGVDSPARDGSDISTQWFATINYAISRAASNDVIYVYGGGSDYAERVEIPTSKNNLTLRGVMPGTKPVLNGLGISDFNQSFGIFIKSDNCKVYDFVIRNYFAASDATDFTGNNEGGCGIYLDGGLSGTVIEGVEIYACNWGIYLPENSRSTIVKNTIGSDTEPIVMDAFSNGGVGVIIWSIATTIEKNFIGRVSDSESGNTIQYCEVDGVRVGYSTLSGGSADQTEVAYNYIANCGNGTDGFGINMQKVTGTVNVKYNTVEGCVSGMDINGLCLDLSVASNTFTNCGNGTTGSTTNILVRASDTYNGVLLFDIWKRNNNQFLQDNNPLNVMVNNAAASVDKTTNSIRNSANIAGYKFIRNTIQSAWDNDVESEHRLGAKGYNPTYPLVGTPTSFVYYEDLDFAGISDVEIYGENDNQPDYTRILFSNSDVCASGGTPWGVQLNDDFLEFHGFQVTGPDPADDLFSVNLLVAGTNANVHHNIFEVTNTSTDFVSSCMSVAIANNADLGGGEAIVDGLVIMNNMFTHNGVPADDIMGYIGIVINHADNGENIAADNITIEKNTFSGYLRSGIYAGQSGVSILSNTFSTDLPLSGDGTIDDGEGSVAIYIFDNSSSNTEQDFIRIECNTITGSDSDRGFVVGMLLGEMADGQELTANVQYNTIQNCYLGAFVGSAQMVGGAPGDNGVTIVNNDFGYDYDVASPSGFFTNGALYSESGITIDATNNWWGTVNGPRHISNTYNIALQGEYIEGDVTFVPWWGEAPTGTCPLVSQSTDFGPVTLRTNSNESFVSYHTSIQSAIDAATGTEGIIWAIGGLYTENIVFNNGNVLALKGKKLADGLSNSFTSGTQGADATDRPILVAADGSDPLVTVDTDGLTIQGFEFDGSTEAPDEDPSVVLLMNSSPIDDLTFRYNTVLMGEEDYGFIMTFTGGLTNSLITYNSFVGPDPSGDADWFSVGDRLGTGGGFVQGTQFTYNHINFATAKFRLSSEGDIFDILFDNNTFFDVNGAIKVGVDANSPGGVLYGFNVLNNTFTSTSFPDEYAFLLMNESDGDNFSAFDVSNLGGSGLFSEFMINYNMIYLASTGLYSAIGISGSDNDYGLADFPEFGTNGQINARSNWWNSMYGPTVLPYNVDLDGAFADWWDESFGTINWPVQRNSWNQDMQGATCDNLFIDFHPWWQTPAGPDINGPIQVKNGATNAITTYSNFFDAIYDNAACDDDGLWDVVSATAGTYTEDFGIWKDFVELRGVSDQSPNAVVIKSTLAEADYSDLATAIGLYLQKEAGAVDNVNIHGLTFEGPDPVSGNFTYLVFVNGTNVTMHHNEFRVPLSDDSDLLSAAIATHNELTDFTPDNSIQGLYIHDNYFTHFGTLANDEGYHGVILNFEAGLAANDIQVIDNNFAGMLNRGVQVSTPGVTVQGNTFMTDKLIGLDDILDVGEAEFAIAAVDNYTSGADVLDNLTFSCNTISGNPGITGSGFIFGIVFPDTDGGDEDFAAPIDVKNNTISDCFIGVFTEINADQILVNKNNFQGNGIAPDYGFIAFAVANADPVNSLDATANWWGSEFGPNHASNAYGATKGSEISDDVDYLPFWTNWINQCPGDAIGNELYPVIVYDDLAHSTLIGVYASINTAINDVSTLANYVVYAANGTFVENVTAQAQANYLESAGTTTIQGNLTLLNLTDLTIVSPYITTGNLTFAGIGNTSRIFLTDADFEVRGTITGATGATSSPINNYIATEGLGSFIKGNVSSLQNHTLPIHAGSGSYFFPVQFKINKTGVTGAKLKARVNGLNPVDVFAKGDEDRPVRNTWYLDVLDNAYNKITNSNSDVYFYFPESGSWPDGFTAATVPLTEMDGCWDETEIQRNVFAARWDETVPDWESRKANSDAPAGSQCRVQQVNTFSPWGVFWGYSNASLVEPPTHADNMQFIGVSTSSITIRVNRGSGDRFMVVVKPGEGPLDCWDCYPGQPGEYPTDGEEYADAPYNVNSNDPDNASWASGYLLGSNPTPSLRPRIVYVSPKNAEDLNREVTITDLAHGTKYFVQVIEFNGSNPSYPNYNVRGWCNLDLLTEPEYNGRWRMTVPIVDLAFKVPPQDSEYEHHACESWQDYFHLTGSGQAPWTVKFTDGITTWALGSPVQSFNPYFQAQVLTTESRTYSLVIVKDAGQRLCEMTGFPELFIHTPTEFALGNEVEVDPNPACNGAPTITFTPNVSGTDAEFSRWRVDEGSGYYDLDNDGGVLTSSSTSYSIDENTGVLTLFNATTADDGSLFIVYFTGSDVCGQDEEVGSPVQTLTVNEGPDPGTISSVQPMPVCPNNAVTLNLTGQDATNWTWQRSVDGGDNFSDIAGYVNTTSTSYIIPAGDVTEANGEPGGAGQYVYRLIAHRPGCASETTMVANYWYLEVTQAPEDWASNDANFQLENRVSQAITLSWDAVTGASYYRVNVWRVSTASYFYTNLNASSNTITVGPPLNPLPDCEDFEFEVTAFNSCGVSNTTSDLEPFSSFCPQIVLTPDNSCPTGFDFGNVYVGAISGSTFAYDITGQDLSTNVAVTLPSNDFEIRASSDGGSNWTPDWTNSALSLDYTELNDGGTWSIEVRFRPLVASTYNCVAITHASSPATTKYNFVSGVGQDNSPTVQASAICFTNVDDQDDQEVTFSWTRGNGDGVVVIVSEDNTWEPLGNDEWFSGDLIDVNDYVAYVGTGTTVNYDLADAGIAAGQDYFVRVYEFNYDIGLDMYFYSVATNATNPNLPKWIVFTTQPTTGQNINSGTAFNVAARAEDRSGDLYIPAANETVAITIENGTGTLSTSPASPQISFASGLTGSISVTWTYGDGVADAMLRIASASCDWIPGFSNEFNIIPSTPTTQSRTMVVTGFSNCGGGTVDVNLRWTNGNGLHRILVVRQGQGPRTPSDGDFYTDVNGDYSSGSKQSIADDDSSWVVDRIDVNNPNGSYTTTVSNMPGNTTFYFRVFDYNGNAAGITRYNTNTASFNPISRTTPACKAGSSDFYVDAGDFLANSFNRKAYLSWNTFIEQGILGYELYRADVNSPFEDFTLVGSYITDAELQAGLNSYSLRKYGFVDNDQRLVVGNEYIYRLIATAIDGSKFDIADQVVTITELSNPNASFVVSNINPNPAVDHVKFDLELSNEQAITVEVIDITGKLVASPIEARMYNPGKFNVSVPLGDIASGTYMLLISSGNDVVMHTFIVNK